MAKNFTKLLMLSAAINVVTQQDVIAEVNQTKGVLMLCGLPMAEQIEIGSITPLAETQIPMRLVKPIPADNNPFSENVVRGTQTAVGVGTVISLALVNTGSLAMGSRGSIEVGSCDPSLGLEEGALSWYHSPTALPVGDGSLRYNRGAIVGNWLIVGGAWVVAHKILAKTMDNVRARFPGAIILPVLFLFPSTATAATNLLRYGEGGDRALGICSLVAQGLISAGVGGFLHPAYFKAEYDLDKSKWASTTPEYVERYGPVFEDYRGGRQWFQAGELAMSAATGVLDGYHTDQSACLRILGAASAVYGAYAMAVVALHPNRHLADRIYFGSVATAQFASVMLNLIGTATNSTEFRKAGNGLAVVTQWVITARSIFDLIRHGKDFVQWIWSHWRKNEVPGSPLDVPLLTVPELERVSVMSFDLQSRSNSPDTQTATQQFAPPNLNKDPFFQKLMEGPVKEPGFDVWAAIGDAVQAVSEDAITPRSTTPEDPALAEAVGTAHKAGGADNPFDN